MKHSLLFLLVYFYYLQVKIVFDADESKKEDIVYATRSMFPRWDYGRLSIHRNPFLSELPWLLFFHLPPSLSRIISISVSISTSPFRSLRSLRYGMHYRLLGEEGEGYGIPISSTASVHPVKTLCLSFIVVIRGDRRDSERERREGLTSEREGWKTDWSLSLYDPAPSLYEENNGSRDRQERVHRLKRVREVREGERRGTGERREMERDKRWDKKGRICRWSGDREGMEGGREGTRLNGGREREGEGGDW